MNPEAGVTVARPAMVPVIIPTIPGFPLRYQSIAIQTKVAVAALMCVTKIAIPALPFAAKADPPLKPNHPTHNIAAPIVAITGLCGGSKYSGNPLLDPSIKTITIAEIPAVACTTKPPAKSNTPMSASQPPPHTQ